MLTPIALMPMGMPLDHVPISLLYAGILGLLLVFLSIRVLRVRVNRQKYTDEQMKGAERAQGNFFEYVPLAVVLLYLVEVAGAPAGVVHGAGLTLVVARFAHAWGISPGMHANYPRLFGAQVTFLVLSFLGVAGIWLYAAQ